MIRELNKIDDLLKALDTEKYNQLRAGATGASIQLLSEVCLQGKALPPELISFFQWHNGQDGNEPLSPDDNRTLLSIEQAIEIWKFFADPTEDFLRPYQLSWIPVLENGAGDYIVYECTGENKGALIAYWHDQDSRAIEHKNLASWAVGVQKAIEKQGSVVRERLPYTIERSWQKVSEAAKLKIEEFPEKETIYVRSVNPFQSFLDWQVFIKMGKNKWIRGYSASDLLDAIQDALETYHKKKTITDDSVRFELQVNNPVYNSDDNIPEEEIGVFTGKIKINDGTL